MDVICVSSLTLNKKICTPVQPIELFIFLRSNDKGPLSLKLMLKAKILLPEYSIDFAWVSSVLVTGHYKKLITNSIFKNICRRKVLTRKKNMTDIGLINIVKNELDISLFGYRQMCHVRLSFLLVVVYFTDHTNLSQQSWITGSHSLKNMNSFFQCHIIK